MTNDTTTQVAPIAAPDFVTFQSYRQPLKGSTIALWMIEGVRVATIGVGSTVYEMCRRCDGSGDYPSSAWQGVCLNCNGCGVEKRLGTDFAEVHAIAVKRAKARAKARAAAARRAEKKAFEKAWDDAHAWDAWRNGRADLIEALASDEYKLIDGYGTQYEWKSGFLGDMAQRVANLQPLTEAQEAAVRRTLAARLERTERKQAAGHLGAVGARVEVEVTVRSARDFENQYGVKYLVIMETAEGQTLKTWSSGDFGWQMAAALRDADKEAESRETNAHWIEPMKVRIKGTVKAHDEYKGLPQTELTRVKVVG